MTRRTTALLLALVMAAVMAACGGGKSKRTIGSSTSSSSSTATTDTTATGATGTTAAAAGATTTAKSGKSTTTRRSTPTSPPTTTSLADVRVKLTPVGSFDQPLAMAVHPGDNAIYIAQRTGKVRALSGGATALDVTALITSSGQEQGLLGLTFSVDGSHLYVNYTDRSGDTHVVEYAFSGGVANPATARDLLVIDQPEANHNGGNVIVGPDNKLWIGMGDGGGAGDQHGGTGNAQNLGTLLGKLLRIDPTPSGSLPYTIPSDNPFVGRAGARGEIWSYGLRNPWRFEFDRGNGDLWIGDVGQNTWEEIDYRAAGSHGAENWGWRKFEGNHVFNAGDPTPPDTIGPIDEYSHSSGGCSVTGGFVYRGSRISSLAGAYIYADFCAGHVIAIRQSGGRVVDKRDLGITLTNLSSFGQDAAGELYALSLGGAVDRIDPA